MPVNRKIFISNNDDDLLNELVENYIDEEYYTFGSFDDSSFINSIKQTLSEDQQLIVLRIFKTNDTYENIINEIESFNSNLDNYQKQNIILLFVNINTSDIEEKLTDEQRNKYRLFLLEECEKLRRSYYFFKGIIYLGDRLRGNRYINKNELIANILSLIIIAGEIERDDIDKIFNSCKPICMRTSLIAAPLFYEVKWESNKILSDLINRIDKEDVDQSKINGLAINLKEKINNAVNSFANSYFIRLYNAANKNYDDFIENYIEFKKTIKGKAKDQLINIKKISSHFVDKELQISMNISKALRTISRIQNANILYDIILNEIDKNAEGDISTELIEEKINSGLDKLLKDYYEKSVLYRNRLKASKRNFPYLLSALSIIIIALFFIPSNLFKYYLIFVVASMIYVLMQWVLYSFIYKNQMKRIYLEFMEDLSKFEKAINNKVVNMINQLVKVSVRSSEKAFDSAKNDILGSINLSSKAIEKMNYGRGLVPIFIRDFISVTRGVKFNPLNRLITFCF